MPPARRIRDTVSVLMSGTRGSLASLSCQLAGTGRAQAIKLDVMLSNSLTRQASGGIGFNGLTVWPTSQQEAEAALTIVRIAEIEVEPNQLDSYKAFLSEQVDASVRVEPGVLFLHAVQEKGAPARVRVVECYVDQAAYEFHLTTPHFRKYKMKTANMVRSLQVIEHEPIRLRAKSE